MTVSYTHLDVYKRQGIYTAGTVDKIQYTPTCPEYVIEFDTAKVQVSEDKAYVEAQAARLPEICLLYTSRCV